MNYIHRVISLELSNEIDSMIKKIKEVFGLDISKIQASKVIAEKSKNSTIRITEKKLVEILGGKNG